MENISTQVARLPFYEKVYQKKVILQHYQYYFFNAQHNLDESLRTDSALYSRLNQANVLLGRFLRQAINHPGSFLPALPEPTIRELNADLDAWLALFKEGGPFNSFPCAAKICNVLAESGYPIREQLASATDLGNAFIQVPYEIKSTFQINIWVEEDRLSDFLEKSLVFLGNNLSLTYYIKEMTIPVSAFTRHIEGRPVSFLAVKFKLIPDIVSTFRNPLVNETLGAILQWQGEYPVEIADKGPFSMEISNNITIGQGSVNYKKFLHLLDLIDRVYDRNVGYTYLLNN